MYKNMLLSSRENPRVIIVIAYLKVQVSKNKANKTKATATTTKQALNKRYHLCIPFAFQVPGCIYALSFDFLGDQLYMEN